MRLITPTPPEKNPKGPLGLRIEDIRELERLAALHPAEAAWKVFIVDDADRMTGPAPQAILKTLEEPPARTVIVLVLSPLRRVARDRALPLPDPSVRPAGGRGRAGALARRAERAYAAALSALAESRAGGADAILRVGEALGRDRAAAETMVEACWLHYRDLLCREGGGDPNWPSSRSPPH